jgi:hypothetical protein
VLFIGIQFMMMMMPFICSYRNKNESLSPGLLAASVEALGGQAQSLGNCCERVYT